MKGLLSMKRTASTSSNILAVSSAITVLSGKPEAIGSLQPLVLGEIIVAGEYAVEAPAHLVGLVPTGKNPFEENLLIRPPGVRLRGAVTARHRVVEPAMRRVGIDVDVVALVVFLERVAKAQHVVIGDDVIGRTEGAEYWTVDGREDLLHRSGIGVAHRPFARGGGTVPDNRCGNFRLGGVDQRMPAGLAVTGDRDPAQVGGGIFRNRLQGGIDIVDRLRIRHRIAIVSRVERFLVGMFVEIIRRDNQEAIAGTLLRKIARVRDQPVALMNEDNDGIVPGSGRPREKSR